MAKNKNIKQDHSPFTIFCIKAMGYILPSLSLIIAIFLMLIPWKIDGFSAIKPVLPLIVIFFWFYMKKGALPLAIIFILMFSFDAFSKTPFGFHSVLYLAMIALLTWRPMFFSGQTFMRFLFGFSLITFVFHILLWVMLSVFHQAFLWDISLLFSAFMTIIFFPICWPILHAIFKLCFGDDLTVEDD